MRKVVPVMAKYHDIYNDLLAKIQRRDYMPNSYLPSESELMAEYDASRDTIRKALNLLLEKGYILKEKGRGSKVLDQEIVTFPMSGITSFDELKNASSSTITTKVVQCENIYDERGQRALNLGPNDLVTKMVRVRNYDGENVILDTDYLNPKVIPGVNMDVANHSLFSYIENTLGLPISFAKKEITVEPASIEEKKLLDMKDYDLLVVVRSYTYLEDATLFEYSVSKHRPDKFRFLDFARRSKL